LFEECGLTDKIIFFFTTSEGENKRVEERAKQLVSKHNQWMGYQAFYNVLKDKNELKKKPSTVNIP
jgi:hypothetical protein